jgi:hypothetical protein
LAEGYMYKNKKCIGTPTSCYPSYDQMILPSLIHLSLGNLYERTELCTS